MPILEKIRKSVLDTLFPINCLVCQEEGRWICEACLEKVPALSEQLCPYCEKTASPAGRICFSCREKKLKKSEMIALESLIVAASYSRPIIQKIIHLYKYNFAEELAGPLGTILVKALLANSLPLPDLIIPVPLHKRRLRWRGFNQAELLAQFLSRELSPGFPIPVGLNILERQKNTRIQMNLKNLKERKINVRGAFRITKNNLGLAVGKRILLIDDVSTTGATLTECAAVLRNAGADQVSGAVVARQDFR